MVTCSTIWCVLLAIALPTEVLSSDSSSDGHNVMKIDFLCGNDVINCESPTYPPNENSHTEAIDADRTDLGASADSETDNPAADDNTSETSVSFQRKRKFSEDEPHHPSSYEVVNGFTTSTDTNHGPMSFVGASSASSSSSAVMQTEDNADGQSANIQSESEIKERVDGILRGEFEPVPAMQQES
ncbi:hypothetical protein IWQ62_004575 [Dispira parvispora]|uniref:Uncharacterized protein n=1 Tax=Dispira parvispora TaxID=1520584 RepID=A0A9W8AS27_9FUNG|nr:hypothetical protein IWQ62_004575 [Dispira parvispora]